MRLQANKINIDSDKKNNKKSQKRGQKIKKDIN